jgi:hypothetical protein
MTSCNDLGQEIKELQSQLDAIASTRRGLAAQTELTQGQPAQKPKVLKTYTGDEVTVDPGEWVTQAEMDAMRMGDETIKQMVQAGFEGRQRPRGTTGRMINYAQIDPSQDNIAQLLEVMGLRRAQTEKGLELRRPFTQQVASQALMELAQKAGADPRKTAELLKRRVAGIDNLPSAVYGVAKARWDSAMQYADVLEELADAIDGSYLTDDIKVQAGNAAKWAHFYEQMDAQVRRRVGQALRSLQFNATDDIPLIDLGKDIQGLTLDQVQGNSLVGDMLKLTAEGNSKELRKRALAKRLQTMNGGVNRTGFMADLEILNTLRRANLLSSVSTWLIRNPISGALVQGVYMAEDVVSGSLRGIAKNGLKPGVADGLQAAGYAGRAWSSSFGMAWGNAWNSLSTGKGTMGDDNLKYITKGVYESPKEFINGALTHSWDELFSLKTANPLNAGSTVVNTLNVMNAAFWKVFGAGVETLSGSDAGYLASFRLLNGGDEFIRTTAYVWKTNHEAFLRAAEEGRAKGMDAQWIERKADELAQETIFSGVFNDDDLAEFRKARNEKHGIPAGDEMPDDELRAMLYNMYKGAPNLANEIGQIGLNRTADVAFTNALRDPITQGIQLARQNPLMSWLIPFWKVPVNGIGWVLNRDILVALPKQLLMESQQMASRGGDALKFTPEQMADARARTLVAAALAAGTHMLWENGLFTDGGPADPRQRERWGRNNSPYSFSLASTIAAGVAVRANGVDAIDLMGLHADVLRAWHEGWIQEGDANKAVQKIVFAWANLIKNKAALKNITSILNVMQDPERYDFADILADQMGGILPLSGVLGHAERALNDPNYRLVKQRFPSAEEMAALGKDPMFGQLQPIADMLKKAANRAFAGYPGLGQFQPKDKDWLGNTVERPLGLPLDLAVPFMPVIKPQDPLYDWLDRHGFGAKPRPNGEFSEGGVSIVMSNDEEGFYREQMRTLTGQVPPDALGLDQGRLMPIWQYVQGQTLQGALRRLSKDERYNAMLNNPGGGISPSLVAQPGKPLSQRRQGPGGELYAPIDDIINYYDRLAVMELIKNEKLGFANKWRATAKQQQQHLNDYAKNYSTLGIGPQ